MNLRIFPRLALGMSLILMLVACESTPRDGSTNPPKSELQFVDLQGFDRDLSASLSAPLPNVDVAFYDRVAPSALPERLQHWMAAVEAGGGNITVVPPKSTVTAKNPLLLLSTITSLWNASKMAREASTRAQFQSAQAYDAQILLKQDDRDDSVVDRVVFIQRKK
jgi:hypothetical protein